MTEIFKLEFFFLKHLADATLLWSTGFGLYTSGPLLTWRLQSAVRRGSLATIMAKKSHKRSPRLRKDNSGCMWGLISMFDFRRGRSTQRLLSDKKRESDRRLGISYSKNKEELPCNVVGKDGDDAKNLANLSDTEAEEPERVNFGVASIKILKEEEMSRAHYSSKESSSRNEWIKAELGLGATDEKDHKEVTNNGMVCSDDHANGSNSSPNLRSQHYPNISDILSSDLDLSAFMVDYCSAGFQCKYNHLECIDKIDQNPYPATFGDLQKTMLNNESATILQNAVIDLTEAFLRQKSCNSSKFVGNTEVQQKEFTNALEILSSNKDLLLKLLQDPDSPIRKRIQELQNVQFGKHSKPDQNQFLDDLPGSKQLQKQSGHYFFRKTDKLAVTNQSNQGDDAKLLKRIVVLKPTNLRNQSLSNTISSISSSQSHYGPENKEDRGRVSSHFSIKEIKRRLRNTIGTSRKERHPITMDGILHKIPYGKQTTNGSETPCRGESIESGGEMKSNTKEILKKNELAIMSNITGVPKKLSKGATSQVPYKEATFYDEAKKHLAELHGNGSERESLPAIQLSKTLGRMLSFPGFNYLSPRLSPSREKEPESPQENTSFVLCHSNQKIDTEHLSPSRYKGSFPNSDKCQEIKNGSIEMVEVEECMKIEESRQLEEKSVSAINEDDLPNETFDEERSPMLLEPGESEERFQPSTPLTPIVSDSAVMREIRDTQCAMGNANRPSPISVLEPLYFEDVSPASMVMEHANYAERRTKLEEPQVDSSAAASGSIDSEANLITRMEFDEASLFDELEISYNFLTKDPKLFFDSIDEVLTEIKDRHFSCSPWMSFIRPNIRTLKKQDYMNEACKRIEWHLDVQFPSTLEQAVKKDLYGGVWIELKFEAENTVSEIGNAILDYLFEETALELWD